MHLYNYLSSIHYAGLRNTITSTAESIWSNVKTKFDYKNHINGLLLGNVQSGKTAQVIGVISKLADEGFNVFILLTTDNVYLQSQTLERVRESLSGFDVIGEYDDVSFYNNKLSKPLIIILKKNTNILKKWRNNISSSGYCSANPIVVIDDEADAASLNTLVNKKRVSTINNHLISIKELSSSSIYIQVTATPQAILLQSSISNWKPSFVTYFAPGDNYLGGDFFYCDPKSFCIKYTEENELDDIRQDDLYIPEGLQKSLMSFLVVCGHYYQLEKDTCNFLIHPSVKISDHATFAERIGEHLNVLISASSMDDTSFKESLFLAWQDLQTSQPDITNFEDILSNVISIIEDSQLDIIVINSKTPYDIDYKNGYNIIVGGNSLGRGITLPNLQTIYYCRKAKSPQADTYWQHARMFGYDRVPGLMRIFTPPSLHKLFSDLNKSNSVLISQIESHGVDGVQLLLASNIKPTRANVIDKKLVNIITGGVNYFPFEPIQSQTQIVDDILFDFSDTEPFHSVDYSTIEKLLEVVGSTDSDDWDNTKFANCVRALSTKRPTTKCRLIVRRGRDISKGTGTLLSPTDRRFGDSFDKEITLTLYRVIGLKDKGWNGEPFWIPNIKFPSDNCFYDINDKIIE